MAWRTVVISNPARLKIENDQLLIIQDEAVALPVEEAKKRRRKTRNTPGNSPFSSRDTDEKTLESRLIPGFFRAMYYSIPENRRELQQYLSDQPIVTHYSIPENRRELQRPGHQIARPRNYSIPENRRELQLYVEAHVSRIDYSIPENRRELQLLGAMPLLQDYSIPENRRELQLTKEWNSSRGNYSIPENRRELQPQLVGLFVRNDYSIPENRRELQLFVYPLPDSAEL